MRKTILSTIVALALLSAFPLRAQGGCEDSPEDPTIFLAVIAGAGVLFTGLRASRTRKP